MDSVNVPSSGWIFLLSLQSLGRLTNISFWPVLDEVIKAAAAIGVDLDTAKEAANEMPLALTLLYV